MRMTSPVDEAGNAMATPEFTFKVPFTTTWSMISSDTKEMVWPDCTVMTLSPSAGGNEAGPHEPLNVSQEVLTFQSPKATTLLKSPVDCASDSGPVSKATKKMMTARICQKYKSPMDEQLLLRHIPPPVYIFENNRKDNQYGGH